MRFEDQRMHFNARSDVDVSPLSNAISCANLPTSGDDFVLDKRKEKLDLRAGILCGETGLVPSLKTVTRVREHLARSRRGEGYIHPLGFEPFRDTVSGILAAAAASKHRPLSIQTIGGTHALSLGAEFLRGIGVSQIYTSNPSWGDYQFIFRRAGLDVGSYSYLSEKSLSLDFEAALNDIAQMPPGQAVVIQGAGHNPTGLDLHDHQWAALATACRERAIIPFLDFAYAGFGDGFEEDLSPLSKFVAEGIYFIVAISFSKNFSLYNSRIGALAFFTQENHAGEIESKMKSISRASILCPPLDGAEIVASILGDGRLRVQWDEELSSLRGALADRRISFGVSLMRSGMEEAGDAAIRQNGFFAFPGLRPDEVRMLKERHAIYLPGNGRISLASIRDADITQLVEAIRDVRQRFRV